MSHAVADEREVRMGLPLSDGKLAMWIFLVTEIMFFTALIGTYLILRGGAPSHVTKGVVLNPWPKPHDVHLVEWMGALNTFVLICSSLTVVLAHWSLHNGNSKKATQFIAITLALGVLFLFVKYIEYKAKFAHEILPGRIAEKLDGPARIPFINNVKEHLEHIVKSDPKDPEKKKAKDAAEALLKEMKDQPNLSPLKINERIVGTKNVKPGDRPDWGGVKKDITGILELDGDLHLSHSIPYGNLWASCYFAMTGFHALHVLGGLVIFVIMLVMAARGNFGPQHESFVELTGLYWHFVDIVWIFLFPLLYLV